MPRIRSNFWLAVMDLHPGSLGLIADVFFGKAKGVFLWDDPDPRSVGSFT